jgi:CheY-like chemotaxis protein
MADSGSAFRTLLVIDDDPSCRKTIAGLLQTLGHTVEAVETGSAGLALLRQTPVDLIVTDLMMPGLNGWDVARLAKAMRPRIPVVLVTGSAHAISSGQPELQFVDAVLEKPFGAVALRAVIDPLTRGGADLPRFTGFKRVGLTSA